MLSVRTLTKSLILYTEKNSSVRTLTKSLILYTEKNSL